jgi:hypothetical protein
MPTFEGHVGINESRSSDKSEDIVHIVKGRVIVSMDMPIPLLSETTEQFKDLSPIFPPDTFISHLETNS